MSWDSEIEAMLNEYEHRFLRGDNSSDDLFRAGLVSRARTREHLDRIFQPLPDGDAVADRVEQFRLHQLSPVIPLSAPELQRAASAHLQELKKMANRREGLRAASAMLARLSHPVTESHLALFDLVAEMDVVVPSGAANDDELALEIRGMAEEHYLGESVSSLPITTDALKAFVWASAWWSLEELRPNAGPEWQTAIWLTAGDLTFDEPYLHAYLISPAVNTHFDYSHWYQLWLSDATLWILPDRVEVRRGGAWSRQMQNSHWLVR